LDVEECAVFEPHVGEVASEAIAGVHVLLERDGLSEEPLLGEGARAGTVGLDVTASAAAALGVAVELRRLVQLRRVDADEAYALAATAELHDQRFSVTDPPDASPRQARRR